MQVEISGRLLKFEVLGQFPISALCRQVGQFRVRRRSGSIREGYRAIILSRGRLLK
jgi:hypothetical protein